MTSHDDYDACADCGSALDPFGQCFSCDTYGTPAEQRQDSQGNACELPLSTGGITLVDAAVYAEQHQYKWRLSTFGYVVRNAGPRKAQVTLRLHRVVMNAPAGMEVDHINGDRLDNRAANLRVCSRGENGRNVKPKDGIFRGTYATRGRWAAAITHAGQKHFLGHFETRVEAAVAYNEAAKRLHGEFARLNNIPESWS